MSTESDRPRGPLRPLSIAPMMQVTDRHQRVFMRQLTRETLLYTEMVTTGAILQGDRDRFLGFSELEKPLALQLGGDDPRALADCARIAEDLGYDEVDLNVGCPSPRVSSGNFGACLMNDPERVAAAVSAMRSVVGIPVTVKHRIGVDALDRYEDMANFVRVVSSAGADRFIVHARKAWLKGLSPKQNRNIPPLRYGDVHRLKAELPELRVEINGGFRDLRLAREQLDRVDGVMIGRAAADTPWIFAEADPLFFDRPAPLTSRRELVEAMLPYVARWTEGGCPLHRIVRHMLNLFAGVPGSRAWKRCLSEGVQVAGAGPELLREALERVPSSSQHELVPAVPAPRAPAAGTG